MKFIITACQTLLTALPFISATPTTTPATNSSIIWLPVNSSTPGLNLTTGICAGGAPIWHGLCPFEKGPQQIPSGGVDKRQNQVRCPCLVWGLCMDMVNGYCPVSFESESEALEKRQGQAQCPCVLGNICVPMVNGNCPGIFARTPEPVPEIEASVLEKKQGQAQCPCVLGNICVPMVNGNCPGIFARNANANAHAIGTPNIGVAKKAVRDFIKEARSSTSGYTGGAVEKRGWFNSRYSAKGKRAQESESSCWSDPLTGKIACSAASGAKPPSIFKLPVMILGVARGLVGF